MRKRLRDALASLGVFAIAAILSFAALEIAVRAFVDTGMNFNLEMWKYARDLKQQSQDPLIGHEHRPSSHAVLMGVDVAINDDGNRGPQYTVERTPDSGRVVMLGDSFIMGWGVPVGDTISARLGKLFDQSGQPVEVVNAGVGNYNTVMEVEAFLKHDAKFKPDMVVLNYDFNDAEPVPAYHAVGFISRYSAAYVFLASGVDNFLRMFGGRQRWDEYYLSLYQTPGWDDAKAAIARLAAYCRQNDIKLAIAYWPELHDVQHYKLEKITDMIREVADAEHLPFIDLLEAVRTQDSASLWVTPPDPHPNSRANALYANYMFPVLKAMLVKPSSANIALDLSH